MEGSANFDYDGRRGGLSCFFRSVGRQSRDISDYHFSVDEESNRGVWMSRRILVFYGLLHFWTILSKLSSSREIQFCRCCGENIVPTL
jgi:hypothetical protein